MSYFKIKIILLLSLFSFVAAAVTPGLAAKRRHDYKEAVRLLKKERVNFNSDSPEYQNYTFEIVESFIGDGNYKAAAKELNSIKNNLKNSDIISHFGILENIISLQTDSKKQKTALDKLLKLFEDKTISAENKLLIVNFLVPFLRKNQEYTKALKLIEALNWNLFDENQYNLTMEYCQLLILNGDYNKAEELINSSVFSGLVGAEELKKYFELLINSYKKEYDLYFKNRPSISRQNSLIHLADLEMIKNLTENQGKSDDYYKVLNFALDSAASLPSVEHKNSLVKLIEFEIDSKKYDSAIGNIEKLIKIYPDSKEYAFLVGKKAELHLAEKNFDAALDSYSKIVDNKNVAMRDRLAAAELAAELYVRLDKGEYVLSLYDFMSKNSSAPAELDRVNLLIGQYYFGKNNFYLAANYLKKVSEKSDLFKNAVLMLMQCNFSLKNYKELEKNISVIDALFMQNDKMSAEERNIVKFYQALMYENTDKVAEAIKIYEELISLKEVDSSYVADAILNLGEVYFALHSYDKAALQFLNFAERYPENENVDKVLYRAVYAYYLANMSEEMVYAVKTLEKKYPKSPYTVKSLFHLSDYCRVQNKFDEAFAVLENLEKLLSEDDLNTRAMVLFSRANIYNENKRYSKALDELNKEVTDYPLAANIENSYFLMGVIYSEIGENLQAIEAFKNAQKNSKDRLFIDVCEGKIADNYFILYSKRNEINHLKEAIKLYEKLADAGENDFFIRTQSFYKLGKSKELAADYQGALDAYNEAIYIALSMLDNNRALPLIWVNKCGANAFKLNLKKGGKNAHYNAKKILDKLKELNKELPYELQELEKLLK